MSLEKIVTSLELSQKLDKIGVEQDSLFYWISVHDDIFTPKVYPKYNYHLLVPESTYDHNSQLRHWWENCNKFSAFTAQELWDMIQHVIILKGNGQPTTGIFGGTQIKSGENIANCLAQVIIEQYSELLDLKQRIAQHEGE